MARTTTKDERARFSWSDLRIQCPICKRVFSGWYCPNCGLPKNNSSYSIFEEQIYYCGVNHFRPGFNKYNNVQLCIKCCTPNPFNANFCRGCGEDISSQAKDCNGNGWVDLGLSVLWSTEDMNGHYRWMDKNCFPPYVIGDEASLEYRISVKRNAGDAASYVRGEKWRTPTKEEFEELIEKCKWEKIVIPNSNIQALKVVGPNGNHIVFTNQDNGGFRFRFRSWTSTKDQDANKGILFRVNVCQSEDDRLKEASSLWLSTPFDKSCLGFASRGVIKEWCMLSPIRPVADKKWKGKL